MICLKIKQLNYYHKRFNKITHHKIQKHLYTKESFNL